jgi:hypothetical protein
LRQPSKETGSKKKKTPTAWIEHIEATEKPKCWQRLNYEAGTERVKAEERRQVHD